jgi:PhnB protein
MNAQTYLYFNGRCEEALEFYAGALGAEVLYVMRHKDGPPKLIPPGGEELIFHSTLRIGDTLISLSDDMRSERGPFGGFAILLHAGNDQEAERLFAKLADQGTVQMRMASVPWASSYGIVRDRFGIVWKVQAGGAAPSQSLST